MDAGFYNQIQKSSAHLGSILLLLKIVTDDENLREQLFEIAFNLSDKNHHKAIWIVELLTEKNIVIWFEVRWLSNIILLFKDNRQNRENYLKLL